jgi:hypothetical protein
MTPDRKKNSREQKQDLQFFIRDFLEKDEQAILRKVEGKGNSETEELWNPVERVLFRKDGGTLSQYFDEEDRDNTNFAELFVAYHTLLQPIWDNFRGHLHDFLDTVLPARQFEDQVKTDSTPDPLVEIDGEVMDLGDLSKSTDLPSECPYPLRITAPRGKSKSPIVLSHVILSFNSGRVAFPNRFNVIESFLNVLDGIAVKDFGFCAKCGACFIKVRSDKEYCSHLCAAKAVQERQWNQDNEGQRRKERERYRNKRKPKSV